MPDDQELTTKTQNTGLSVEEILLQKAQLTELMKNVLKDKEHYGIIPGTKKRTLYKAGAEIVALCFGIHPEYEVERIDLPDGHVEYIVTCSMFRNSDGMKLAQGVGSCSSMESKYRYRKVKKFNPETEKQEETQIENPKKEDQFNTVLKMAKKRAMVDGTITSTGSSDFVTQDMEDVEEPESQYKEELEAIKTIEELKKYWQENKGKGKEFDKAIAERKKELQSNDKKDEKNTK